MTEPLTTEELELVDRLERRAGFFRERAENLRAPVAIHDAAGMAPPPMLRAGYERQACAFETEAFDLLLEARALRQRQDAARREQLACKTALSTDDLVDLLVEAAAVKDEAQIFLCRLALAGDAESIEQCRRAFEAAQKGKGSDE